MAGNQAILEDLIERFETHWRSGRRPRLESFLKQTSDTDTTDGQELVAIDLEYRWRQTHRRGPLLEQYVKRLSGLKHVDALPIWLIGEEYRARQRFGDHPPHAEYAARFPRHGQALLDELFAIDAEHEHEYGFGELNPEAASQRTFQAIGAHLHDPAAPLHYGDFAIRRLLGEGASSRVYAAVQKSLGKPVALKVLRKSQLKSARAVQRFLREARVASQFDHVGLVDVRGVGRLPDGGYFMVLPLIDGPDLARLAADRSVTPADVIRWVAGAADQVQQLHEQGWLHCDLKPSNILVASSGQVWLTDFAMAQPYCPHDLDSSMADDLAIGGTPAFMAPEQREGDRRKLSRATDVYALGGMLRFLLPSVLATSNSGANPLQEIAAKCLAESPGERIQTAGELAQLLHSLCSDLP